MGLTDPKEVWDVPKKQYKAVSQAIRDAHLEKYLALKIEQDGSVLQFRAYLSKMESQLNGVGYCASDEEMIGSLLRGLQIENDVTAEIIRNMGKSLSDGVALLINKEATLLVNDDVGSSAATSLNTVSRNRKRIQC